MIQKRYIHIGIGLLLLAIFSTMYTQPTFAQQKYMVRKCVYKGDTIPEIYLKTVYVFKPLKFKSKKKKSSYDKLVRNVKKTLPIAKEVNSIIIETYLYLETLPNKKAKEEHIKKVEKGLKEQYTPKMKKLTFAQGKLLIKLIDRECNQSSYELVKAFMGPFKAGFYQTFASLFGASLKKEYQPEEEDAMVERVVLLVENGQI